MSDPLPPSVAIQRALGRYRGQSLGIRGFVLARHILAPLARVLDAMPPAGRLLDVGCGHGLFANALALGSLERDVLGVDPSGAKIAVARASAAGLPNARFQKGLVQDVQEDGFDGISILDVLYLLPVEEKLAILRACRERISPNGVLVLKTNDTRPPWKYRVARLQEQVMTGLGLTLSHGDLHFLSREQNAGLLELAGFQPRIVDLNNWLPYPHVMFVSRPV
ncbi:MAG: methyltransferase domain-containing protein [Chloroflexi bacterium]|nr:methyltransferase domain-containing protein [Chloroflexota bacterium]